MDDGSCFAPGLKVDSATSEVLFVFLHIFSLSGPAKNGVFLSTLTLFIIPPCFCCRWRCQVPSLAPSAALISLHRCWPRCRRWHHFVQISPHPALSQIGALAAFMLLQLRAGREAFGNPSAPGPSLTSGLPKALSGVC